MGKRNSTTRRRCSNCKIEGDGDMITFDPVTRWWLCDNCLKRQRMNRKRFMCNTT